MAGERRSVEEADRDQTMNGFIGHVKEFDFILVEMGNY